LLKKSLQWQKQQQQHVKFEAICDEKRQEDGTMNLLYNLSAGVDILRPSQNREKCMLIFR
jgi:hypothetical protein